MEIQTIQVCKCCGRELPISEFSVNRFGRKQTCNTCNGKKIAQSRQRKKAERDFDTELAAAKNARLQDFSPRELMAELKRRGYEFTMSFTETHIIKSDDIDL